MSEALESWHSAEYAAAWAGEDVIANLLELPRRLSTAIVADAGVEVGHVIDLGSGPGTYLEHFLQAFPDARGTWTARAANIHLLAGGRDGIVSAALSSAVGAMLPKGALRWIADGGHLLPLTHPAECAALIREVAGS